MRPLIPSTGALLAFEAVARHLSFSRAADELALTQSAVSRQIKSLEELLNARLFERLPKTLTLTRAGEEYLPMVVMALESLAGASSRIINLDRAESTVRLCCTPSLAGRLLIPRLVDFHAKNPSVHVELVTDRQPINITDSNIDMAVNMGRGAWPGTRADILLSTDAAILCSPAYRDLLKLRAPADLERAELLQPVGLPGIWASWAEAVGIQLRNPHSGWRLEQFQHAMDVACGNGGVALVPRAFSGPEIERGQLVELFPDAPRLLFDYLLFVRNDRQSSSAVTMLRDWLLAQTF